MLETCIEPTSINFAKHCVLVVRMPHWLVEDRELGIAGSRHFASHKLAKQRMLEVMRLGQKRTGHHWKQALCLTQACQTMYA